MPSTFERMKKDIETGWDETIWSESYGMGDAAALAACLYYGCAAQYLGARLKTLAAKVGQDFLEQVFRNKGKVVFGPGNLEVQAGDAYWSVYHGLWNPLKSRHEKITTERYVRLYVRYGRRTGEVPAQNGGFKLQTGTALNETGDEWEFALASNRDLFAIKKQETGSESTEVHVLSAASNYQEFALHSGTALSETGDEWEFALASNRDLFAIKKQETDSKTTEVHVLSAASNYQEFALHSGTALSQTGDGWEFALAPNRDLFAIKKQETGSESTEVHVLSAASNYQEFALHSGTALHETDDRWEFGLGPNRDLFAIKKQETDSYSTEVHVLSATTNYEQFTRHIATQLHPTQENWTFAVSPTSDLFGIKMQATGSESTEVHIIEIL